MTNAKTLDQSSATHCALRAAAPGAMGHTSLVLVLSVSKRTSVPENVIAFVNRVRKAFDGVFVVHPVLGYEEAMESAATYLQHTRLAYTFIPSSKPDNHNDNFRQAAEWVGSENTPFDPEETFLFFASSLEELEVENAGDRTMDIPDPSAVLERSGWDLIEEAERRQEEEKEQIDADDSMRQNPPTENLEPECPGSRNRENPEEGHFPQPKLERWFGMKEQTINQVDLIVAPTLYTANNSVHGDMDALATIRMIRAKPRDPFLEPSATLSVPAPRFLVGEFVGASVRRAVCRVIAANTESVPLHMLDISVTLELKGKLYDAVDILQTLLFKTKRPVFTSPETKFELILYYIDLCARSGRVNEAVTGALHLHGAAPHDALVLHKVASTHRMINMVEQTALYAVRGLSLYTHIAPDAFDELVSTSCPGRACHAFNIIHELGRVAYAVSTQHARTVGFACVFHGVCCTHDRQRARLEMVPVVRRYAINLNRLSKELLGQTVCSSDGVLDSSPMLSLDSQTHLHIEHPALDTDYFRVLFTLYASCTHMFRGTRLCDDHSHSDPDVQAGISLITFDGTTAFFALSSEATLTHISDCPFVIPTRAPVRFARLEIGDDEAGYPSCDIVLTDSAPDSTPKPDSNDTPEDSGPRKPLVRIPLNAFNWIPCTGEYRFTYNIANAATAIFVAGDTCINHIYGASSTWH